MVALRRLEKKPLKMLKDVQQRAVMLWRRSIVEDVADECCGSGYVRDINVCL
jgi:hypothetical protein